MILDYDNREIINSLSFSDYLFEGFFYNYDASILTFSCLNQSTGKRFHFSFYQTILINMQSCNLWGKGNAIYDISYNDNSSMLTQLHQIRSNSQSNLDKSKLDTEVPYLCLSVWLNSGDELSVLCKNVEIACEDEV